MAPRQASNSSASEGGISTEEIIFSCGICQATVSEVYADKDAVHGLSSSGDESGIVTKLWIGDCSHVFCGKHLDGGGAPFHSKDDIPKAQCPVCISEQKRGHEERRCLFPIRGLGRGEYDEAIPDGYLRVPPVKLHNSDRDMDAMRFQYTHLIHYGKQVTKHWKTAEKKRRAMESTLSKERKQWRKQEAELKERIVALERSEVKLKKWEARRAMIDHYLGLVAKMGEDIKLMRSQLLELGFEVPESQYAFEQSKNGQPAPQQQQHDTQQTRKKNSSATLAASSSSRKRKHPSTHGDYADADDDFVRDKENHVHPQRRDSRELMPPPLRPSQQPPQTRRPEPVEPPPQSQQPIQVYADGEWHGTQPDAIMQDHYDTMQRPDAHPASYHDHGALPFRPTPVEARQSQTSFPQQLQPRSHGLRNYGETPMSSQSMQRQGYLAMPPRRRSQQFVNEHPSEMEHSEPSMSQQLHSSQIDNFANGMTRQDHGAQVQRPYYDPPVSHSQPPVPQPQMLSTPSLRKPLEPVNRPAASPFFGSRPAVLRPDTIQRPPARASMIQHPEAPASRLGTMGRQYGSGNGAPAQSNYRMAMPPPSSLGSQPYAQPRASQTQHQSLRQPPFSSQAPPMSDGVFQRPAPPRQYAPSRPMSEVQSGRLTLPPSRSQAPMMGSQDSRLSMIPGMRGAAASQHVFGRQQSLASAHNASRYLSSVAGPRRPVQR